MDDFVIIAFKFQKRISNDIQKQQATRLTAALKQT